MRFLADENFNGHLFDALEAALPSGVVVRVQDIGLMGAEDPAVLAWAADNDVIVLTHDVQTFIGFAYERVAANLPMPGVFIVKQGHAISSLVEDLEMVLECSGAIEWKDRVVHLPF